MNSLNSAVVLWYLRENRDKKCICHLHVVNMQVNTMQVRPGCGIYSNTAHVYLYICRVCSNTRAPLLECRTYLRNCLLQQYRVISIPGQHSQQLHGRRKDNAVSIDIWKYIVQNLSSFYAFHKCVCPAFLQTSL